MIGIDVPAQGGQRLAAEAGDELAQWAKSMRVLIPDRAGIGMVGMAHTGLECELKVAPEQRLDVPRFAPGKRGDRRRWRVAVPRDQGEEGGNRATGRPRRQHEATALAHDAAELA